MIVPNPFFVDRGFAIRVYEQANYLQKNGYDVIIISYYSGRKIDGLTIKKIPNLPGYDEDKIGASFSRLYLDFFLLIFSFIITLKFKPQIIHTHLHEGALIGIIIKKILKIPVILDAQGSLTGELRDRGTIRNKTLLRVFEKIEKFILSQVDFIITSSPITKEIFIKKFNVKPDKCEVILDFVDVNRFKQDSDEKNDNMFKKMLGIPDDKKICIYVGVLHPYYGVDVLLTAIKYVVNETSDLHFIIAGFPNVDKYKLFAKVIANENGPKIL
jgi:glycosyltransferase involved in cell wall biosynthesis